MPADREIELLARPILNPRFECTQVTSATFGTNKRLGQRTASVETNRAPLLQKQTRTPVLEQRLPTLSNRTSLLRQKSRLPPPRADGSFVSMTPRSTDPIPLSVVDDLSAGSFGRRLWTGTSGAHDLSELFGKRMWIGSADSTAHLSVSAPSHRNRFTPLIDLTATNAQHQLQLPSVGGSSSAGGVGVTPAARASPGSIVYSRQSSTDRCVVLY